MMDKINFRIRAAGEFIQDIQITSVLDVGCRGCEALNVMPPGIEYFANDLFQNKDGLVNYVGDIQTIQFDRKFDCVLALDIVEHVDDPYTLMDKLISLADKHVLISLPNIYDVSHKIDFVFRETLGRKYNFSTENSLDRHRWIMNYEEVYSFFQHYSRKYDMKLETKDLAIGERSRSLIFRSSAKVASIILGKRNMTRTVVGLFTK